MENWWSARILYTGCDWGIETGSEDRCVHPYVRRVCAFRLEFSDKLDACVGVHVRDPSKEILSKIPELCINVTYKKIISTFYLKLVSYRLTCKFCFIHSIMSFRFFFFWYSKYTQVLNMFLKNNMVFLLNKYCDCSIVMDGQFSNSWTRDGQMLNWCFE